MKNFEKTIIRPSMINLRTELYGSGFKKREFEIMATYIIYISLHTRNNWFAFSEDDYREKCNHKVKPYEFRILEKMWTVGFLDYDGSKYSINDNFLNAITKFLKN